MSNLRSPISSLTLCRFRARSLHDLICSTPISAWLTIAWEVTRACAYACVHCRADAQHQRDPNELSPEEGLQLIDRLAKFSSGDGPGPISSSPAATRRCAATVRPDRARIGQGLRCSLTPTATALPTLERLEKAMQAGIRRIALGLDAPTPEAHDAFRQVPGSWERTMRILRSAQQAGLSAQVNTTVSRYNLDLLPEMVPFVKELVPCSGRYFSWCPPSAPRCPG